MYRPRLGVGFFFWELEDKFLSILKSLSYVVEQTSHLFPYTFV